MRRIEKSSDLNLKRENKGVTSTKEWKLKKLTGGMRGMYH